MRIAILTVATGSYCQLYDELIESIKCNFLPSTEKTVFLFSDQIKNYSGINVCFHKIKHEAWPLVALKKLNYFSQIIKDIKGFDYIFYFDSDLYVNKQITNFEWHNLFAVSHPGMQYPNFWTVETNPKSKAYLDPTVFGHYVQSCFWGGKPECVINMISQISDDVESDLRENIIPIWYDESYINRYFFDNSDLVSTVSFKYSYPESLDDYSEKGLIIHRLKNIEIFHDKNEKV